MRAVGAPRRGARTGRFCRPPATRCARCPAAPPPGSAAPPACLAGLPTELRPTLHCDGVFDVAWGPDGTWVLVAYVENGSMRLAQVPVGQRFGVPRLIGDLGHTDVDGLTGSPDGTRAAFSGSSDIDF